MLQSCGTFNFRHAASWNSGFSAPGACAFRNRQSVSNGSVTRGAAAPVAARQRHTSQRIRSLHLPQMIEIVPAHGFDHGLQRHRAALRMSNRAQESLGRQALNQRYIPLAHGCKSRERPHLRYTPRKPGPSDPDRTVRITGSGSASVCRMRKAKTTSQSARWQRISRTLHLPGAGERFASASESPRRMPASFPGVSLMTPEGLRSPRYEA